MTTIEFDAEHARDFLRTMYGAQNGHGYIQICGTGNWAGKVFATDDIDNAVDYAMHRDKILDRRKPGGVYVRCTTLKAPPAPGDRGGADDTLAVPYFWSDIDFGSDGHKGGDHLPPTAEDAQPLVAEAGLPEPTTWVHSGGGWYALWVPSWEIGPIGAAQVSVNIQLWLEHASQKHGWKYGTGVSDLARVIRLPGSVNRKLPLKPRPCRVVGGTGKVVDRHALPTVPPEKPKLGKPARELTPARSTRGGGLLDGLRNGGPSVLDALDLAKWSDILGPKGWSYVKNDGKGDLWLRSGDDVTSEYSARCFENTMVCWSESAGLPSGKDQKLNKAKVWAWLNGHEDDMSAATLALIRGDHDLPRHVADAITEAANSWEPTVINVRTLDQDGESPFDRIAATDDELATFLGTYTRFSRPDRLGRRIAWMQGDSPTRLTYHARHMIQDVLEGHYPALRALHALADAARRHGVHAPDVPRQTLASALGQVLHNLKVSAG